MVQVLCLDKEDLENYLYKEIKEKYPKLWQLVESKRIEPKMAVRAYHEAKSRQWDIMTALGVLRGRKWLTFD